MQQNISWSNDTFEGQKEKFKVKRIGKQKKLPIPDGNIKNYCAVFGALAGQNVKATSTLLVELIQLCVLQKMNICQEISVPGCFVNFRGKNNKNAIQNETGSYALGFG